MKNELRKASTTKGHFGRRFWYAMLELNELRAQPDHRTIQGRKGGWEEYAHHITFLGGSVVPQK